METLRATFRGFKGKPREGQSWRYADVLYESARGLTPGVFGGTFPSGIRLGDWFIAQGTWKEGIWQERTTQSFRIKTIRPDLPVTSAGARELLLRTFTASAHGITEDAIRKFVERHGDDTARKVEKSPDLLLEMSKDPRAHRANILRDWGRRNSGREAVNLMAAAEMPTRAVEAVLESYRDDALKVIKENPYRLATLPEVGFANADRLGQHLGIGSGDPRRVSCAIVNAVHATGDGHTYMPLSDLNAPLAKMGIDTDAILGAVRTSMASPHDDGTGIKFDITKFDMETADGTVQRDGVVVQRSSLLNAERTIARRVAKLAVRRLPPERLETIDQVAAKVLSKDKYRLFDDVQKAAVANSAREAIAILTGGPGTGKSTVTEAIADIAEATSTGGPLILLAPTGKAARRLAEATGRQADTVHRRLKSRMEGGHHIFEHNAENPLPEGCFVVVDEASMLDAETAAALLEALPEDGRLLLVGDRFQLPSVGAGYVLGDLLAARGQNGLKVSSSELVNVYRQGKTSMISTGAALLKEGKLPYLDKTVRGGVALFEHKTEQIVERVVGLIKGPIQRPPISCDPRRDVIVLCPQAPGPAGTWQINARLSAELNPSGAVIEGVQHGPYDDRRMPLPRVGDRVMLTKNDADNEVMNGDVGTLVAVTNGKGRSGRMLKVEFDSGQTVEFPVTRWRELSLAYAITGHKSQGSQYPVVIMPVTTAHAKMLERTLIYTEWTRAKEWLFLVGEREALELAAGTVTATQRRTRLKPFLEEELDRLTPRYDAAPSPQPRRPRRGLVASPDVSAVHAGLSPTGQGNASVPDHQPSPSPAPSLRRPRRGLVAAPDMAAVNAGLQSHQAPASEATGQAAGGPPRRTRRGLVAAPAVAAAAAGLPASVVQQAPQPTGQEPVAPARPRRRGLVAGPMPTSPGDGESYEVPVP